MFRFSAGSSGQAGNLNMRFLQKPGKNDICNIGISLYNTTGFQIGSTFIGAFDVIPFDVSNNSWLFVSGGSYYVSIQTLPSGVLGNQCIVQVPWGQLAPSAGGTSMPYTFITQQGPDSQSCGASPWTTVATVYGGYIPFQLTGMPSQRPAVGNTSSNTATPSQRQVIGYSSSYTPTSTPTPSQRQIIVYSSSNTPTVSDTLNSVSNTPSATNTPSLTITDTYSSVTTTPTVTNTPSATNTPLPTVSDTYSSVTNTLSNRTNTPSTTTTSTQTISSTVTNTFTTNVAPFRDAALNVQSQPTLAPIIAGSIGGFILIAGIVFVGLYYANNHTFGKTRSPVGSVSTITHNPVFTNNNPIQV